MTATYRRTYDIDSAFDAIDDDVLAVRDRALLKAAAMVEGIDDELTRLRILEDCVLTLKSANDSALVMLQRAIRTTSDRLDAERLVREVDQTIREGRRGHDH